MADVINNAAELNGTAENAGGTNRVRGKVKSSGSFMGGLYALRDKSLPESTMLRRVGPDGLTYTVRVGAVAVGLTVDAIAEVAKEHGGRVRVSDPDGGTSGSWGVTGEKAAETVRKLTAE
jgi:hypothetical protein